MPTETQTNRVLDEVAEIVRRVGRRDEIETEIAENVSFSDLVSEQIKVDGPIRDAAIRAIVAYMKGYEIEGDSDEASKILKAIDFKKFVPTLLQSKDFQDTIGFAIKSLMENGNLDISSAVREALDEDELKKILGSESMKEVIADKLKSYVEDFDMSNLGDDFYEKLNEVIFSQERIASCLKDNADLLDKKIMKKVENYLDNDDGDYDDSPINKAIGESKEFQKAVDKAIDELIYSGCIIRLVEKVATDMLSSDESELKNKLTQAISTQLVNRIASDIVDKAFGR